MPVPEPLENSVAVIAHCFRLKRVESLARAMGQLRAWNLAADGCRLRGEVIKHQQYLSACAALQKLIEGNVGKYIPKDSDGPTPEQAAKPARRDSIQTLEESERITPDQARAAREIQKIVELITVGSQPKCQTYQRGASGYRPSGFMSAETAYRWSQIYVPWHRALGRRKDTRIKAIAIKVIVDGLTLDNARIVVRINYDKAHRMLVDALDLYIKLRNRGDEPLHEEKLMVKPLAPSLYARAAHPEPAHR